MRKQVKSHSRIFVFGEMVAILCAQGRHQAAIELEQLGEVVSAEHGVSILCTYPASIFERKTMDVVSKICQTHTHVRVGSVMTPVS